MRKTDIIRLLLTCVVVCSLSIVARAEEYIDDASLDSITAHTLNEVIVTANRFTEVIPSQKLTRKEIEALNSLTVADALRYFSGIQLNDYGGVGFWCVYVN